jgi:uncharacterized protein (DUF1810 family)
MTPDPHNLQRFLDAQHPIYGRKIEDIFGYPDHLKFHSSMTLFAHVGSSEKLFSVALTKYFNDLLDRKTHEILCRV